MTWCPAHYAPVQRGVAYRTHSGLLATRLLVSLRMDDPEVLALGVERTPAGLNRATEVLGPACCRLTRQAFAHLYRQASYAAMTVEEASHWRASEEAVLKARQDAIERHRRPQPAPQTIDEAVQRLARDRAVLEDAVAARAVGLTSDLRALPGPPALGAPLALPPPHPSPVVAGARAEQVNAARNPSTVTP